MQDGNSVITHVHLWSNKGEDEEEDEEEEGEEEQAAFEEQLEELEAEEMEEEEEEEEEEEDAEARERMKGALTERFEEENEAVNSLQVCTNETWKPACI